LAQFAMASLCLYLASVTILIEIEVWAAKIKYNKQFSLKLPQAYFS